MEPYEKPVFSVPDGAEWTTVGSGKKSKDEPKPEKKSTGEKRGFRELREEIDPQIREEWEK